MNIGFNISRKSVQSMFFDRQAVTSMMDKRTLKFLRSAGGYIRKVARNSIKTKRVKMRDMDAEERKKLRIRRKMDRFYGRPLTKPPKDTNPSPPGEPPRSQTGVLRDNIFFALDAPTSVFVGPAKISSGSDAPAVLEHGGVMVRDDGQRVHIAPRPYMAPAMEKATNRIDQFWD